MALVLCVACGALAWVASWFAFGGGGESSSAWHARLQVWLRMADHALETVSTSRLQAWLMKVGSFRLVAVELATRLGNGNGFSVARAGALLVIAGITVPILGLVMSRSVAGLVVALLGECVCLALHALSQERKRAQELAEEMPNIFRTLATALESGHTLVQAIDYVGLHGRGPARDSFVRTSLRLRCGMSMEDALVQLTEELDAPGVSLMATALAISQRTGSPLRDLFQRLATLVERSQELERTLGVRTAQVRLSVRIVVGLPLVMVCLLSLISADYQQGLTTAAGLTCLLVAAGMDGLAIMLIRKILGKVL